MDKKSVIKNNVGQGIGQRETRPVWDNTARVNHQNKLTHPHPKRNFFPAAILTKSRQIPVNAAKQSSHKAAASVSAARHVNTVVPRPNVNKKPKTDRPSAPVIEEWQSDSDNDSTISPISDQPKHTPIKINFIKPVECVERGENEKQAKKATSFTQNPKVDRKDWNELKVQKLGLDFGFTKKACFVCGSLSYLIRDCTFHKDRMDKKSVIKNNVGQGTGQRETRPVWDNTARVNHQNKLTHPHPKRNFVPAAILTKSRQVPVNAAKQSSHKAAASVSAARYVNNVVPRPNVNSARPKTTQDLVIIKLIKRVKRLERELKARTPPTKIQKVVQRWKIKKN
uniref:Ribonuclease H-like domain, Gag-pre-integrase domain protein n=1 Tax=Tanacetum cinerariifolium TaxID=118510 RepID=A0A6L2M8M5_TANCI|nr:ribonuclease H-like domain, Gag-pre-integrase domain protein [Tanacetum cinerariifolium]